MERCYIKCKSYLREAVKEIAKKEGLTIGQMAAFTVASKDGLFSVTILVEKDEIKINQIDLSESFVVTYNTVHNEDGSIETFADCVSRDVFESGILNNERVEVSKLLDYKRN